MPVLRQAPDNTLAETLGGLGNSLSSAFNPLNMVRSQNLQSEIAQRQWEIRHQQTLDAANRNAADVYERANPFQQDPASLAVSAAKIRAGQGDLEGAVNAAKGLQTWQGNQAAAALIDADPEVNGPGWSDADRASVKARVLNGEPLAVAKQQHAQSVLDANKTTQTLSATGAAQTPASKEAAALGQPETSVQLDAANTLFNQPPITGALGDPDVQKRIDQTNILRGQAKIPVTAEMPVSSGLAAPTAQADIAKHNIETQAAPRAPDLIVPAVPPTDPLTGQPVAVPPGGAPPAGVVSQAPQGPDISAISGTKSAETAADEGTKFRAGEVQKDVASGTKAYTLLRTVALMREYANELDNVGPWDQAKNQLFNKIFEGTGVTITNAQSAREAFTQISKQLMGAARTDDGIQRVAGPEIQVLNQQMPNAQQDRPSLMRALDQLEGKARRLIEEGRLANDLYGATGGNISGQQFADYTTKRNAIEAPPTTNKPAGTADTTDRPPPPITPPPPVTPSGAPQTPDAITSFLHWFTGGGSSQAQPAAPAPSGSHELKMINGRWQ